VLLHDLLAGIDLVGVDVVEFRGDPAIEVRAVVHDSRQVDEGALFCCIPGKTTDGHDHAAAAARAGATAFLVERFVDVVGAQIRVPSVRAAIGPIAARLLGDPSHAMSVLGVTGTNGNATSSRRSRSPPGAAPG
jgi:UDP-N-acetylmuramyl tripeptide synthase